MHTRSLSTATLDDWLCATLVVFSAAAMLPELQRASSLLGNNTPAVAATDWFGDLTAQIQRRLAGCQETA
ncbi:hypothetical protein KXV92_008182, partial [Aspergillus fumigatus]